MTKQKLVKIGLKLTIMVPGRYFWYREGDEVLPQEMFVIGCQVVHFSETMPISHYIIHNSARMKLQESSPSKCSLKL